MKMDKAKMEKAVQDRKTPLFARVKSKIIERMRNNKGVKTGSASETVVTEGKVSAPANRFKQWADKPVKVGGLEKIHPIMMDEAKKAMERFNKKKGY